MGSWRRYAARFAAPAVFLAAVTAAVLLVRSAVRDDDTRPTVRTGTTAAATTTRATRTRPPATTRRTTTAQPGRFHTIESGDTLGSVALEYDTTVQRLLELNPGIDPGALRIGERIRVG